ncbi:hypothetical protein AUR64_14355 [Haloprofundus marisrubri]|uniref:Uncharacterized protein n=1 Tax=Haloprofundus marisrubri TaxID=1514971 RepID=A0A0W1R6C1_9EURY|nr:hypothetical protein [Haloprofundus marisrubri]KTG08984.1 hypothetical protein AUR64_14355 [Haloprofundus marisrubri]
MSTNATSSENCTDSRNAREAITNIQTLRRGDRILFEDRSKPLTVVNLGTREFPVVNDEDQLIHLVKVRGGWANAKTYILGTQRSIWTGEITGIVCEQTGFVETLWRVSEATA